MSLLLRRAALAVLCFGSAIWPLQVGAAPAPAITTYCFERVTDDGRPRPICIRLDDYAAGV